MNKRISIEEKFINFFSEKEHHIQNGSNIIPPEDSGLLFNVAGMVALKDFFLGVKKPQYKNMASAQKCIRLNDIDEIGDTSHLTSFTMLGIFSFGGYDKEKAIDNIFSFITSVGIQVDDLKVTVYKDDEVAFNKWLSYIPKERILRCSEDSNFWFFDENGPCGPCTEIFYDRNGEMLEIGNIVSIQYMRNRGVLTPLLSASVDVGLGCERIEQVTQNVNNVFETSELVEIETFLNLQSFKMKDEHKRIIIDHFRTLSLMLFNNVFPGNNGRNYAAKKLFRRMLTICDVYEIPFTYIIQKLQERNKVDMVSLHQDAKAFSLVLSSSKEKIVKKSSLTTDEAFFICDTMGCPVETLVALCAKHNVDCNINDLNIRLINAAKITRAVLNCKHLKGDLNSAVLESGMPITVIKDTTIASDKIKLLFIDPQQQKMFFYVSETSLKGDLSTFFKFSNTTSSNSVVTIAGDDLYIEYLGYKMVIESVLNINDRIILVTSDWKELIKFYDKEEIQVVIHTDNVLRQRKQIGLKHISDIAYKLLENFVGCKIEANINKEESILLLTYEGDKTITLENILSFIPFTFKQESLVTAFERLNNLETKIKFIHGDQVIQYLLNSYNKKITVSGFEDDEISYLKIALLKHKNDEMYFLTSDNDTTNKVLSDNLHNLNQKHLLVIQLSKGKSFMFFKKISESNLSNKAIEEFVNNFNSHFSENIIYLKRKDSSLIEYCQVVVENTVLLGFLRKLNDQYGCLGTSVVL